MCVICAKPANVQMIDDNTLLKMAMRNPDGFGFATTSGKSYRTIDFNAFLSRLKELPDRDGVIIHFRYATHGSVKKTNCHPFYDKDTDVYFMHNGVLPIASVNDMTDSEIAFRTTLVPAIKRYGIDSDEFGAISSDLRGGSRFAYVKDGHIYLQGNFSKIGECYFSNTYWSY